MNVFSFQLALLPKLLQLTSKDKAFGSEIGVSTIPISSKFVQLLVKLVNGKGVGLCLTSQKIFRLISLLKRNKIVIFLNLIVSFNRQLADIGLRIDVDLNTISF